MSSIGKQMKFNNKYKGSIRSNNKFIQFQNYDKNQKLNE